MCKEQIISNKLLTGVVIRSQSGHCAVVCDGQEYNCRLRGKLKQGKQKTHTVAVVGDKVDLLITDHENKAGVIEAVHDRSNKISRMASRRAGGHIEQVIMANLDQVVIVQSVAEPSPVSGFVDRILVAGKRHSVKGVLCVNKCDIDETAVNNPIWDYYSEVGCKVIYTSAKNGLGLSELKKQLSGRVSLLAGVSGAGKTSLLSEIMPGFDLRIGDVSEKTGLGRHTTTRTELYPLDDGFIADSAGIRGFDPWGIQPEQLADYFPDFMDCRIECKFSSCIHENEPVCGVKKATALGKIPDWRYKAYLLLLRQIRERMSEKSVKYKKKW